MTLFGPTPAWNGITLKWAGVTLDGQPITGKLKLTYNLPTPLLDTSGSIPISVYPTELSKDLTTAIVQYPDDAGVMQDHTIGYASWVVPATDDTDIQGNGGTYTLTENLLNAKGQTRVFTASKDVVGGVIWLNQITSTTPVVGETISAVSVSQFNALKTQVDSLGTGGGGGGGLDSTAVHQSGAETISGVKTFSTNPVFNDGAIPVSKIASLTKASVGLANAEDTSDANKPVSTATATALGLKVAKGALTFNVKDYGAVGDWSTGTTGTNDLTAINLALAAAATAASTGSGYARVLFPWTASGGYMTLDTVTVPAGVELDMRSPIVYAGPTGRAALLIGGTTAQRMAVHTLRVKRNALTTWTDELDAGIVIRNQYSGIFNVLQADNFTVGVTFLGDTSNGFSYNKVYFGQLVDNKITVDLSNDTSGWCNENQFYGGRFAVSSGTYTTLDRTGVRITSRATTKYYNNANTFYSPSFELKGAAITGVGTCVDVVYGSYNEVLKARHESNSSAVLVQRNASTDNNIDFQYSDEGATAPTMSFLGTGAGGKLTRKFTQMIDSSVRTIHKANTLAACYYDGATSVNIPGFTVGTSATGNTDARAASSLVLGANYVEIPSTRYAGFYMKTDVVKRFAVMRDAEATYGGRIIIRCYNAAGTLLTDVSNSGADVVKTTNVINNPTYATSYGGAWRMGVDSNSAYFFQVSPLTDYVFIGVAGGTNPARLRALSVATLEQGNPVTWLAFPEANPGANYATTPPTAGTWAVGKVLINAAPTANSATGWVCVAAGTPGTWRATSVGFGDSTFATSAQQAVPWGRMGWNFGTKVWAAWDPVAGAYVDGAARPNCPPGVCTYDSRNDATAVFPVGSQAPQQVPGFTGDSFKPHKDSAWWSL